MKVLKVLLLAGVLMSVAFGSNCEGLEYEKREFDKMYSKRLRQIESDKYYVDISAKEQHQLDPTQIAKTGFVGSGMSADTQAILGANTTLEQAYKNKHDRDTRLQYQLQSNERQYQRAIEELNFERNGFYRELKERQRKCAKN